MSIVPLNQGDGNGSNFWDVWDPFVDFPLAPSISNFFPGFGSSVKTRVDWKETPRAHVWHVVLPGFSDEDVLVELQDERVLQVSVESGNFMTRFKIPDNGNLEQLKANMHYGILVVTVPKFHQLPDSDINNNNNNNRNVRVVEIDGTD